MIKNIVFDIGNVLVRWQPTTVVESFFPQADAEQLTRLLFKSPDWLDLNRGKMTEAELIARQHKKLDIEVIKLQQLMQAIKESMLPIDQSFELLQHLSQLKYPLYALTDNVREIVNYLRKRYHFWDLFQGVVCSAEVGYLKPMPEIYQVLLSTYSLLPQETLFIDDHLPNVEGAKAVDMASFQFFNVQQCVTELNKLLYCPIDFK